MKPQSIVAVLLLLGCILILIGICMLLGTAWAFISAGVMIIAMTVIIVRGMNYATNA